MILLLVLWEGVKRGLGEYVLKVMEVVWHCILEGLGLYIPGEDLC